MLADPRADALGPRFAGQWLRLQDVDKVHPDPNFYPNFEAQLGDMMKRETELFFISLVREDRSMLDLLRADYTFLNERLARHYGIPGVAGPHFRKVTYPDDTAPRPLRPGQRAGADVVREPHVRRAARQVGDGSAARHAAAAAADGRLGAAARGDGRRRGRPRRSRRASAWRCTARIRRATRATASSIRSAWRSTASTSPASGARARTACRSTRAASSTTARRYHESGGAVGRAAQAAGAARAHVHRKPDGLRAGPARRVLRPALDPRHHESRRGQRLQDFRRSSSAW